MMRDECCPECESPDAVKIKDIHTSTGSQYIRKLRTRITAYRKPTRSWRRN